MIVNVTTHSGESDIVEVENYDAEAINKLRNDDSIQAILIGNNSYSRIDLKNIKVVKEETTENESE